MTGRQQGSFWEEATQNMAVCGWQKRGQGQGRESQQEQNEQVRAGAGHLGSSDVSVPLSGDLSMLIC